MWPIGWSVTIQVGRKIKPLAFEAQMWKAADALRSNMDAAEYKHVVLGLSLALSTSPIHSRSTGKNSTRQLVIHTQTT